MTAAEYQAGYGQKKTAKATVRARLIDSLPSPIALIVAPPEHEIQPKPQMPTLPTPDYANPDTRSATWLFDSGRLSVSLARPHGRQRLAIAGVPDEALVVVVLGAIQTFYASKP